MRSSGVDFFAVFVAIFDRFTSEIMCNRNSSSRIVATEGVMMIN